MNVVSNHNEAYLKIDSKTAQTLFNKGIVVIYVMTDDRDPISSLTMPHKYVKGCKPYCEGTLIGTINNFDEVLEDFADWLNTNGYGHEPEPYKAKNLQFSYWLKIERN